MEGVVSCLGVTGVCVFFIISGFIITNLLLREKQGVGHVSLKAFYIRRFFRIIPTFAAYLVALLIIGALGYIFIPPRYVFWSALFLGDAGLFGSSGWFVAHTWSLSVEEQFYLVFPPLLCLVCAFRTAPALVALSFAYLLSLTSLNLAHLLAVKFNPHWLGLSGLYNFRYIIVGCFLALYGECLVARLANRPKVIPVLLGVFVMGSRLWQINGNHVISLVISAIEPLILGLFVMWFVKNPSRCGVLRWPVVQWLGKCSYGIYLWQQLFTGVASNYHGWGLAQSPLAVVAIVLCAGLSHYLIEIPSIRLGRRFSRRPGAARDVLADGVKGFGAEVRAVARTQ